MQNFLECLTGLQPLSKGLLNALRFLGGDGVVTYVHASERKLKKRKCFLKVPNPKLARKVLVLKEVS